VNVPSSTGKRVALYARVSTTRQAEADLSIPDQIRQALAWCEQNGMTLVRRYTEPGASGTDENRPIFQEMLAEARTKPRPFDIVVVHSLSRFCRDGFTYATATRDLERAGIALHSLTQPVGNDHTGQMMSSILVNFDAYQSRENGKHTSRAMKENARQGFWNGSLPPFGYRTIEADRRGEKVKKALAMFEPEAEIVRRIFSMYLGLEGRQYGIKGIVTQLNAEGVRFRGKQFAISNVHRILILESYAGRHWFNVREAKSGKIRPRSEWVAMEVPYIIERPQFDMVQALLADRNPKRTPPRVVTGPILLTGVAECAACGSGMTLRTGKSNRYRYYACAGRAQKGPTKCEGCAVPMDGLDTLVLDQLANHVFQPDRLTDLLKGYLDQSQDAEHQRRQLLGRLKAELTETEGAIQQLLALVEKGLMDLDDPALAERFRQHRAKRERLGDAITLASSASPGGPLSITPAKLDRLAGAMRNMLKTGPIEFRRAYLRMFVNRIVVSRREVRISGPKAALAKAATSDVTAPGPGVLSFIREWRPVRDSNPCYQRERLVSWASRRTGQTHPAGARRWVAEGLSTVKATWSAGGCVGDDEPRAHRTIPFFRTQMTGEVQRQSSACKHCLRQRTVARTEQHGLQARPAALAFDEGAD
jgi:site-specific DNA recombinase